MAYIYIKKGYKFFVFLLLLTNVGIETGAAQTISETTLKSGDLLFAFEYENNLFSEAIQLSTAQNREIPFTHVGIVRKTDNRYVVIEANPSDGVCITPIFDFLAKYRIDENHYQVWAYRLTNGLEQVIPNAIIKAQDVVGASYDFLFSENNDSYYCSELVRYSYVDSLGSPIFPPISMTFKDKITGKTVPFWEEYFHMRGEPIPEGKPGSNPINISQSKNLFLLGRFF